MAKSKFIQAPPRKQGKYRINAANAYNLCIFASAVVSFLGRWELGCTSLKVTPSGETQKVQIPPLVILKFIKTATLTIVRNSGNIHDYSVIHLLVVDVLCVLFWTQSACVATKQNTRNIYHKQMNN